MQIILDKPFELVASVIQGGLSKINPAISTRLEDIGLDLVLPPNRDLGDFAFGCFKLAKLFSLKPNELAQQLVVHCNASQFLNLEAAGPYLNLRLHPEALEKDWAHFVLYKDLLKAPSVKEAPKTMVEFSQPNTHKELHVGHMRNACLGDAVVRLKRAIGVPVISSTFPGDIGTHVAKCLWYLKYHNTEPVPQSNRGEWIGTMYSKGHLKLEDELGTDKEANNREQLTQILKELENQSGPFFELWKETKQWSLELMQSVYDWADIQFDKWYWESDVDEASRAWVQQLFDQGKLIRSQGAIGMDLSEEKLGFCLLLKSDGTGLYATKDLELARRKFEDFKIERSIYVVDLRQALHFSQVFKVLEKLGFDQAKNCYHLQYNFVELPDGAMSSRKGNIVPIMKLVHGMESMIKERFLSRYQGEWLEAEMDRVAHQVAVGAIKYGMLRMDTSKKIVFELENWLKLDVESGPFIQYSAARIKSLIKKVDPQFFSNSSESLNWSQLKQQPELLLLGQALYLKNVVRQAALQEKPHLLTSYLYELAKSFNYFYHECPIAKAESPKLTRARLSLAALVGKVLEHGLSLLGIQTPERM